MIKSIIVEDDPNHSINLVNLIKKTEMPVEVMAISASVDEAIVAIEEYKPELIFLDIELKGGQTGFDLLKAVGQTNFGVIFTTSHVDDNIQQIRICGISYIAKPYILEELEDALFKYITHSSPELEGKKLNSLRTNMGVAHISEKTTWITDKNIYLQLEFDKILFCESDNQYTHFHVLGEGTSTVSYISSYGIGIWEKDLQVYNFCRISRSHLVNVLHVKQFQKTEDRVILSNGKVLSTSQRGKEKLLQMIKM